MDATIFCFPDQCLLPVSRPVDCGLVGMHGIRADGTKYNKGRKIPTTTGRRARIELDLCIPIRKFRPE